MSNKRLKALFLGDICGQPGCRAVFVGLKQLIKEYRTDVVIANGENASDGFGITPDQVHQLNASGIDIITSGNHIWQHRDILPILESSRQLIRPANYPPKVPGTGVAEFQTRMGLLGVVNLQGRESLPATDCPFRTGLEAVTSLLQRTRMIIVDFHAELVEEKEALAMYLQGKVSAVLGTHTHVQTADERILPKGTAYISDVGMTGPEESVIGSIPSLSVDRQLTQMPLKSEVADHSSVINGVVIEIDPESGNACSIERINKRLYL